MKRGGRFYLVDGKRVPEDEYRAMEKAKKTPSTTERAEQDSGKSTTKQQRGKQS